MAFLLILIPSTIIAPYKYAALLELWDYWIAAIYSILVYSLFKENEDSLEYIAIACFFIGTVATILSVILIPNPNLRWSGSFISPLDFGIFCLLLFLLGLFCFERATLTVWKVAISIGLIFLVTYIAMASSRAVFLATGVMLIYYLWKKRSSRLISTFIVLALIGSAVVIYIRLFHFSDPFQYYRLKIWKYSLQGILQDPYLGIGLNMLPYRAGQFNFPADQEVGRYSRIATTADNQYLQILIETGFVGFFLFLIGWISLYFGLRKLPSMFLAFQGAYIVITIISFFTLPLTITSILFLFLFLILFAFPFDPEVKQRSLSLNRIVQILLSVFVIAFFVFAVYFPYRAHLEARAYGQSRNAKEAQEHLRAAIHYNPFQPYIPFNPIRRIVDARPPLETEKWIKLANEIDHLIALNPLESDFYVYKAKIYRILMERTGETKYYPNAVSNYQMAIQYSPFNVFLRIDYAFFETKIGHLKRAESELKEILKLEPAYLNGGLLLAEVYVKEGQYEAAKKQFNEVENMQRRYVDLKNNIDEPYLKKLIQVDETYKNQVKNLIFNTKNSKSP